MVEQRTLADEVFEEAYKVRYAVYLDAGEGVQREVKLVITGCFDTCREFLREQSALGVGSYYRMRKLAPDEDPKFHEVRRSRSYGPSDYIADVERGWDKADYEQAVGS